MIVLVGNAPSSGSTFLADLLDSTPISACGPELYLFASHAYHFSKFQKDIESTWSSPTPYMDRLQLPFSVLSEFGMSYTDFKSLVHNSRSFSECAYLFKAHYLKYRDKPNDSLWFEKTPQNIFSISRFLDEFPNEKFLCVVRNPIFVCRSLLKRNVSIYQGAAAWLLAASQIMRYQSDDRVLVVRYEDLVKDPFNTVSNLVDKISGKHLSSSVIQENYEGNAYRKNECARINSWNISAYGGLGDGNSGDINQKLITSFVGLFACRINQKYAGHFGLNAVSMIEALEYFGYYDEMLAYAKSGQVSSSRSWFDIKWSVKKWWHDYRENTAYLNELGSYISPLVID